MFFAWLLLTKNSRLKVVDLSKALRRSCVLKSSRNSLKPKPPSLFTSNFLKRLSAKASLGAGRSSSRCNVFNTSKSSPALTFALPSRSCALKISFVMAPKSGSARSSKVFLRVSFMDMVTAFGTSNGDHGDAAAAEFDFCAAWCSAKPERDFDKLATAGGGASVAEGPAQPGWMLRAAARRSEPPAGLVGFNDVPEEAKPPREIVAV
mmetsp:Transcript_100996/g.290565  ORF Transcript_100996/g.290565 Transcript_100996/m.290565 type:complete len:207 (-) Transcript_100996:176-796(-)